MSVLDQGHLQNVKQAHAGYIAARREVIKLAGDAQAAAKRAIFALHRDDMDGADGLLTDAERGFASVRELMVDLPDLAHEGSYRAALEEYVEAVLYRSYVRDGKIGDAGIEGVTHDIYLGGLADTVGELQRRQVRLATEGDVEAVGRIKDAIAEVIEELVAFDLGGYLRTKFDQAKNALRRAEDVVYDVTIRRG